jgi:glycosyltransferase involved in cell wall biosynthesis
LLIVGDAPYATEFKQELARLAAGDPRVTLVGAVYGKGYQDLQRAAMAYIQATSVGGTHPALIEAMGAGNLVLAYGTPENVEVLGGTGLLFNSEKELSEAMARVVADPGAADLSALRLRARDRAARTYSWEAVTDGYVALWRNLGAP